MRRNLRRQRVDYSKAALRWFLVEPSPFGKILRYIEGPRVAGRVFEEHDFIRCAVAAFVRSLPYLARLYFTPLPAAGHHSGSAHAIQNVFLGAPRDGRDQIGTVVVAAEGDQVSKRTLGALYAMANPGHEVGSPGDAVSGIQA